MPQVRPHYDQKQQKVATLPPPHPLSYLPKTRSKTNNQNYQTQADVEKTDKKDVSTFGNQQPKKYSKSFVVLKPNVISNNRANRGLLPVSHGNSKNLVKIDSRETIGKSSNIQNRMRSNQPNPQASSHFRSKILSTYMPQSYEASLHKANPYQRLVKELNIRLPTPEQKFKQFIRIAPFNRLKNHTDFISHMLLKSSIFFRIHPPEILDNIAKKIIQVDAQQIPDNYLLVLDEGVCWYGRSVEEGQGEKRRNIEKGGLIVRNRFQAQLFKYEGNISIIGLPYHQYSTFVSQHLNSNMGMYRKFMESIQIFKIFTQTAMEKIFSSLTLQFFSKGEYLYTPNEPADTLYLIYAGSAARKITIQIDKTNKILQKKNEKLVKLVKVLSRSYEHKIQFKRQDLVGVADIIDNIQKRSQNILIDEDTTILTIDRVGIEQNLDEYIVDRLRKYNMKKYPKDYDELCQNYLKQKIENRKTEQRKIHALQDEIFRGSQNGRKNQKINAIIKVYQDRIRLQEKQHLTKKNKTERIVQNQ